MKQFTCYATFLFEVVETFEVEAEDMEAAQALAESELQSMFIDPSDATEMSREIDDIDGD